MANQTWLNWRIVLSKNSKLKLCASFQIKSWQRRWCTAWRVEVFQHMERSGTLDGRGKKPVFTSRQGRFESFLLTQLTFFLFNSLLTSHNGNSIVCRLESWMISFLIPILVQNLKVAYTAKLMVLSFFSRCKRSGFILFQVWSSWIRPTWWSVDTVKGPWQQINQLIVLFLRSMSLCHDYWYRLNGHFPNWSWIPTRRSSPVLTRWLWVLAPILLVICQENLKIE